MSFPVPKPPGWPAVLSLGQGEQGIHGPPLGRQSGWRRGIGGLRALGTRHRPIFWVMEKNGLSAVFFLRSHEGPRWCKPHLRPNTKTDLSPCPGRTIYLMGDGPGLRIAMRRDRGEVAFFYCHMGAAHFLSRKFTIARMAPVDMAAAFLLGWRLRGGSMPSKINWSNYPRARVAAHGSPLYQRPALRL